MTTYLDLMRDAAAGVILFGTAAAILCGVFGIPGTVREWLARNWGPSIRARQRDERHERAVVIIEREFANGVPPDAPGYVPLRRAFDTFVRADAERWRKHDADAVKVRERLEMRERLVDERTGND